MARLFSFAGNHMSTIPWSEFPFEFAIYFVLMGMLHLVLFAGGCLLFTMLAIRERGNFRRRAGRLGLFLGLFLLAGSVANGLWSCLVWGRLYYSTDYVFDFSPFWPITQRTIDAPFGTERGRLLGVSLFHVQLVWLLFAAGTWAAAILLYRRIGNRRTTKQSPEPTGVCAGRSAITVHAASRRWLSFLR